MKFRKNLVSALLVGGSMAAISGQASAHSYYNLTGAGVPVANTAGDTAIGFGIANSINGTDGVSANSNGTNRIANGNVYNPANPGNASFISGTGGPAGTATELSGNLPYMWYSGQHTKADGVTKRELFTGSSVSDTTGNLTHITGTGNGNTITLPNGQSITAPSTGSWGTNNVAGLWNAYSTKNGLAPTPNAGNASTWGTIMADLPANGDHPYQAVAGNSSTTGLGLDYGLIHISCGANSATDNCASAGNLLTTISVANDSDYSQYNGLLDVALYRGADTSLVTSRNAAADITGVTGPTNIQGANLGAAIWSGHMTSVSDILSFSFIFNQAEWLATDTNSSGLFSSGHTNGFYTLVIGGHGGLSSQGFAYDALITTSAAPVPVPAAVWLFGSAMAGLIGFGRRKQQLAA